MVVDGCCKAHPQSVIECSARDTHALSTHEQSYALTYACAATSTHSALHLSLACGCYADHYLHGITGRMRPRGSLSKKFELVEAVAAFLRNTCYRNWLTNLAGPPSTVPSEPPASSSVLEYKLCGW